MNRPLYFGHPIDIEMNINRGEKDMMKNKITKYVVNGALLAVMAAIGLTAYQLGTTPSEEIRIPEEVQLESALPEMEDDSDELLTEDVGISVVEANLDTGKENVVENELVPNDETEILEMETSASEEFLEDIVLDEDTTDVSANVISLPELDFSENTLMEWPVNGHILLDYSMDQTTYFPTLDQYKLNPAIAVQAVEGAPVMASVDGTVFSIAEDIQTGTTVTMELGNGFQAIYGQLKDLTVAEGEMVTKGTIIGYVNTPTKYYSREGSNVYFAMKENGKPVDPIAYLP